MSDSIYIIYSKNRNPFLGELPKYIMQYHAIFKIKIKKLDGDY